MKHLILLRILIIPAILLFSSGLGASAMSVNDSPEEIPLREPPVFARDTAPHGVINDTPGNQADSSLQKNLPDNKNQPAVSFKDIHFKVYPNPGQGMFHLEINNKKYVQFDFGVYDLTGKEIWQKNTRCMAGCKININLRPFNDGIYLLKIQSGNQQKVLKLLKQ
ncbi:MAG: T9SS type A sorting domain-containing protein [Bacteroidales bacterium]|nr:T9SS type A sorting domain-containing protein [Bacteroidales bacterium]